MFSLVNLRPWLQILCELNTLKHKNPKNIMRSPRMMMMVHLPLYIVSGCIHSL